MTTQTQIRSREFEAPFVRVRGRLNRNGQVQWSPCLRTFREPTLEPKPRMPVPYHFPSPFTNRFLKGRTFGTAQTSGEYVIAFEDAQKHILTSAPTVPEFFARDQESAVFGQRIPYRSETERVVLRLREKELGVLHVTKRLPEFALLQPVTVGDIDPSAVLRLRWKADASNPDEYPITYHVRFTSDGKSWVRPGVNLRSSEFDLSLPEMPGGDHCVAQVIATNGYQTAFVETPTFVLPRKSPKILVGSRDGPILFAQGFSREYGPIVDEHIVWFADEKKEVGRGGTFDVRRLRSGRHQVTVRIQDPSGMTTSLVLGIYHGNTGLRIRGKPGA
jgi:hypothetical protein